jgi:toxin ParE1/3/4
MDDFTGRWSQLARHPHSGPSRDDLGTGIRCLVIGQYLVFYRIGPDEVTILRVLHGKREIGGEEFV